jgi:hypothetical protein
LKLLFPTSRRTKRKIKTGIKTLPIKKKNKETKKEEEKKKEEEEEEEEK